MFYFKYFKVKGNKMLLLTLVVLLALQHFKQW